MITVKNPEEIKIISQGGRILAGIIKNLEKQVRPGVNAEELNRVAEALIFKFGAKSSFRGFDGFPAALCVSVNEEIVHGLPSGKILQNGDIVSLDLGIKYKGYHSDMAVTLPVGNISPDARGIIRTAKKALKEGLKKVKPGKRFGDIGRAVQEYVEGQGFNVPRELCGHGIGKNLHEDPQVLNYGEREAGPKIAAGMVFCLEPMIMAGDWHIKKSKDGFGFQTKDGSLSAHFEHTIAVTKTGCQILTER